MPKLILKDSPSKDQLLQSLESWKKSAWTVKDVNPGQGTVILDEKEKILLVTNKGNLELSLDKLGKGVEISAELKQPQYSMYGNQFVSFHSMNSKRGGFIFASSSERKIYCAKDELTPLDFRNSNCTCITFSACDFFKPGKVEYRRDWGYTLILIKTRSQITLSTANNRPSNLGEFLESLKKQCKGIIVLRTGILDQNQTPLGISKCDGKIITLMQRKNNQKNKQKYFGTKPLDQIFGIKPPKFNKEENKNVYVQEGKNIQETIFPAFYSKVEKPAPGKAEPVYKSRLDCFKKWATGERETVQTVTSMLLSKVHDDPHVAAQIIADTIKKKNPFYSYCYERFAKFIKNKRLSKWRLFSDVGIVGEKSVNKVVSAGKGYLQIIARKKGGNSNHYYHFNCKGVGIGKGVSFPINLTVFLPTAQPSPIYLTGSDDIKGNMSGSPVLVTAGDVLLGSTVTGFSLLFLNISDKLIGTLSTLPKMKMLDILFLRCKGICFLSTHTFTPTTIVGTGISVFTGKMTHLEERQESQPTLKIDSIDDLLTSKKSKKIGDQVKILLKNAAKRPFIEAQKNS